jgi:ABC-type multidrug transport system fused ATPase/permease subunit
MKFDVKQKLGILILGIIFITFFVNFVIQKSDELYLKRSAEFQKNYKIQIEKQRKLDKEKLDSFFTEDGDLQEGFFFGFGSLMGLATSFAETLMGIMTTLLNIFFMFAIYAAVVAAMGELIIGIFNHVVCGGKQFGTGISNTAQITGMLIKCAGEKIVSFADGSCTRYYIVDMIFGLIYGVFVELPIILIYAITTLDLQFLVDLVYEMAILPVDTLVFMLSGYHIVAWSDSVINKCYRCEGTVNGIHINQTFGKWVDMYKCSLSEIKHGFLKVFTALIPSAKWGEWIQGKHLDGWDDQPEFFS